LAQSGRRRTHSLPSAMALSHMRRLAYAALRLLREEGEEEEERKLRHT